MREGYSEQHSEQYSGEYTEQHSEQPPERLSKEFVFRSLRTVVFIVLVALGCMIISSLGIMLAGKFGLTTSREQVPLTRLVIDGKEVELPIRGQVTEGNGWTLRNTRGQFVLTLAGLNVDTAADTAAAEKIEEMDSENAGLYVDGDLTIELKKGSENRISSTDGPGILKGFGTLVIRGEGSLTIQAETVGIAGTAGMVSDEPSDDTLLVLPSVTRVEGIHVLIEAGETEIKDQVVEIEEGAVHSAP